MVMPTSGQISLLDARNELGLGGQIALGQSQVRTLAQKPSGQIAMSDLYGKSNAAFITNGGVTKPGNDDQDVIITRGWEDNAAWRYGSISTNATPWGPIRSLFKSHHVDRFSDWGHMVEMQFYNPPGVNQVTVRLSDRSHLLLTLTAVPGAPTWFTLNVGSGDHAFMFSGAQTTVQYA